MPLGDPYWKRRGETLERELGFRDFDAAMRFMERVAECAEDHLRRPDMCVSDFNRVRLVIANPHHAPLTPAEERLRDKVDQVIEAANGRT